MTRYHLFAAAGLTALVAGIATPADDRSQAVSTLTDAQKRENELRRYTSAADAATRERLLAAFPMVSLEDRLKFDAPGRARVSKQFPTGDLDLDKWRPMLHGKDRGTIPPAAIDTLTAEERIRRFERYDRSQALATLHNVEVRKFVANPGFGMARMVVPRYYPVPETPPKDWSEADRGEPVSLPTTGTFFTPPADKKGPTMPAADALAGFHASTTHEFVQPDSWGLVKDKKQVAGFQSHGLSGLPEDHARRRYDTANPTRDPAGKGVKHTLVERWAVRRVELIGLLMHDTPVVYKSQDNKLPTMADAPAAAMRELNEFEAAGLKDLAAGKDVVSVSATVNQVRMVGAIRMADACMKCHDGKRGDLLGAFTYDLVRDPAFVPVAK